MSDENKNKTPAVASRLRLAVWLFTLLLVLSATSCSKPKDVTNDPGYGNFKDAVGSWKTKIPLTLFEKDKRLDLVDTNLSLAQGERELAAVPVGTVIRIEHLILWPSWECDTTEVVGSLVAGPYAGKSLMLDGAYFFPRPGPTKSGLRDWTVLPEKLEPSAPAAEVIK